MCWAAAGPGRISGARGPVQEGTQGRDRSAGDLSRERSLRGAIHAPFRPLAFPVGVKTALADVGAGRPPAPCPPDANSQRTPGPGRYRGGLTRARRRPCAVPGRTAAAPGSPAPAADQETLGP
ncbi:hypothetical protein GCM10022203_17470 [Micrococcus yunnanensis]